MPPVHGVELDANGADLLSFRTARDSTTRVLVYVESRYLGGFEGNVDPDGSPDYEPARRGPDDGDYFLKPKSERDYGGAPGEYLPGTPSITGEGRPTGSPAKGWKNTVRFHPCGRSTGCQTGPLEWANRIWDLVEKYPDATHLHLRTVDQPVDIPTVDRLPRPRSHPWPAFNSGSNQPIP